MKYFLLPLLLISLFFWGCTGPAVNTETAASADFGTGEYDTYAYLPSGDTASNRVVFDEAVIREVNQEMEARGYRLDTSNPDLLVMVKSMYDEETRIERSPVYASYDYYAPGFYAPVALNNYYYTGYTTIPRVVGTNIREIEYTQGTFVVDVIDRSTNEIIWRGWSRTPVDPLELDTSIRSYVDNIFEEFPVEPTE